MKTTCKNLVLATTLFTAILNGKAVNLVDLDSSENIAYAYWTRYGTTSGA